MEVTVSNKDIDQNILAYWRVWIRISSVSDFWVPYNYKQFKKRADAIEYAVTIGTYNEEISRKETN